MSFRDEVVQVLKRQDLMDKAEGLDELKESFYELYLPDYEYSDTDINSPQLSSSKTRHSEDNSTEPVSSKEEKEFSILETPMNNISLRTIKAYLELSPLNIDYTYSRPSSPRDDPPRRNSDRPPMSDSENTNVITVDKASDTVTVVMSNARKSNPFQLYLDISAAIGSNTYSVLKFICKFQNQKPQNLREKLISSRYSKEMEEIVRSVKQLSELGFVKLVISKPSSRSSYDDVDFILETTFLKLIAEVNASNFEAIEIDGCDLSFLQRPFVRQDLTRYSKYQSEGDEMFSMTLHNCNLQDHNVAAVKEIYSFLDCPAFLNLTDNHFKTRKEELKKLYDDINLQI